jgi:hypothetical protein
MAFLKKLIFWLFLDFFGTFEQKMCLSKKFKARKKKTFSSPKIAWESPKYALKSSKSTIRRGKNYLSFFKLVFGVFWPFSLLNLTFSGHWHLATLSM